MARAAAAVVLYPTSLPLPWFSLRHNYVHALKAPGPYTGSHLYDEVSDVTQGTCFGSQFAVSRVGWTASWLMAPEKEGKCGVTKQSSHFMETRRLGTRHTLPAHALSEPPPPPGGPPSALHQLVTLLTASGPSDPHFPEAQSAATPRHSASENIPDINHKRPKETASHLRACVQEYKGHCAVHIVHAASEPHCH